MIFQDFLTRFWLPLLISAVVAYLLGSINFAIIITKCRSNADIRDFGSGNAGATNVLRSQGKTAAALTTLGDLAKSMLAVFIGGWLMRAMGQDFLAEVAQANSHISLENLQVQVAMVGEYVAGICCIMGHLYPLYFGFRGGKGVMATLGMMLVLDWRVALVALAVFLVVVALSRMVSLGSITAGVVLVAATYLFRQYVDHMPVSVVNMCTVLTGGLIAVLIAKHAPNIQRIIAGTENKISFSRKK